MQDDLIFRITSFLPYPWVSRMDRTIYQQYPQLDPVKMLRKCIFASLTGYWIANLKGWNRYYSAIFATCPLLAKFLWDEWTLSKTLTPYGTIDFKGTAKLSIKSHYPLLDQPIKLDAVSKKASFHNIRRMPLLQSKILNAKDFIEALPQSYFK